MPIHNERAARYPMVARPSKRDERHRDVVASSAVLHKEILAGLSPLMAPYPVSYSVRVETPLPIDAGRTLQHLSQGHRDADLIDGR